MSVIQGIYIALFGRPADPGGLAYWSEVTKNGQDLSEMLRVLPSTEEYTGRFTNQTPDQVIETIYQALFQRAADPVGLAFFTEQLASGAHDIATIAVNILQGAQGTDRADIDAKVEAANLFTASLDTPVEIAAYVGDTAAGQARQFLSTVNRENPADPLQVDQAVVQLVSAPVGGQAPGGGGGGGGTPAPTDVVSTRFGSVSDVAKDGTDKLYVGSGNKAGNFEITTTSLSQFELALKGYHRGVGDVTHDGNAYKFGALDKAGFAYSVSTLGGKSIQQLQAEGYSVHLRIDTDATAATNFVELTLDGRTGNDSGKDQDSGYNWSGPKAIIDDEGTEFTTQNIQTPIWYDASVEAGVSGAVKGGLYAVELEVRKEGRTVANEAITLDIAKYSVSEPVVGMAANTNGKLLLGSGISAGGFQIVSIDTDQNGVSDINLALGAQIRRGGSIDVVDGRVVVEKDVVSSLQWSVESKDGKSLAELLTRFDIKLHVDTVAAAGTSLDGNEAAFTTFTAKVSADAGGALDWDFLYDGVIPAQITDDAGNANVSQNSQALSWLAVSPEFGAVTTMDGEYTIVLALYEKGTANIVGSTIVYFDAAGA